MNCDYSITHCVDSEQKRERTQSLSIKSGCSWTNSHSIIFLEATKCKFSLVTHFNFIQVEFISIEFLQEQNLGSFVGCLVLPVRLCVQLRMGVKKLRLPR